MVLDLFNGLLGRCCRRRGPVDIAAPFLREAGQNGAVETNGAAETEWSKAELAAMLGNLSPGEIPSDGESDHDDFVGATDAEVNAAREEMCKAFVKAFENACTNEPLLAVKLVENATTAEINSLDETERSILLLAAMEGHVKVCRALLARPDFHGTNSKDMIGSTALHFAAGNDHDDVVRLLITSPRFTAGVNVENSSGKTPLDFAIEFADGNAAEALMSAGAVSGGRAPRKGRRQEVQRGITHRTPDLANNMEDLD